MFQKLIRELERNLLGRDPLYRDPYDEPAEQYYARIYTKYLFEKIDAEFRHQRIKILDLGCHTGRLSIPLARAGHQVTGIDSSRFHVKRAEHHAKEAGVSCRFLAGDAFRFVEHQAEESFDLVLCTEVLYQREQFREDMASILRVLRSGGLLATSHRTRFFYLSRAIRERNFKAAETILQQSEGELWGSYFNWQAPSDLKEIYQGLNTDLLLLRPIGFLSGNGADGMAAICNLAKLAPEEWERLSSLEAGETDEFAAIGRYILAIGRKR